MNIVIYKITSPSNKSYIGQTRSFRRRMNAHKNSSFNSNELRYNSYFYKAIRKYGWNNMTINKLIICDEVNIDYYEKNCIKAYNTLAPYGYNLETGGLANKQVSEETRCKMSKSARGNKSHYGMKHSEETKLIISKKLKNNKYHYNQSHTEESKSKMAVAHGTKPFQVFKNNILIGSWMNINKCARDLNLNRILISRCLKGEAKIHKKFYTFKYMGLL